MHSNCKEQLRPYKLQWFRLLAVSLCSNPFWFTWAKAKRVQSSKDWGTCTIAWASACMAKGFLGAAVHAQHVKKFLNTTSDPSHSNFYGSHSTLGHLFTNVISAKLSFQKMHCWSLDCLNENYKRKISCT